MTTDHISPAGSIKADSPAGKYLAEHGVERKDFNSYGSRRGNHEVMIRGTFANIRLRNQLAPGHRGRLHPRLHHGEDGARSATIYDASVNYAEAGIPLVILAGKEYGSGSSRDWAAKGTALLGVRAVIAESYERIHRSNLIGMGVLPLQFPKGESAETLGLTGTETFTITGITGSTTARSPNEVQVQATPGRRAASRGRSPPPSGSTPPARPTTTGTAGSCSTCCARCSSRAAARTRDRGRCSTGPPSAPAVRRSPCRSSASRPAI